MAVYFVFSDEAGDYSSQPTKRFLRANPYFVRVGVVVKGEDWPLLRDDFSELQSRCQLPKNCELKWADICSIIQHRQRGEPIPRDRSYAQFRDYTDEELLGFVKDTIGLLKKCEFCSIIYTITDNYVTQGIVQPKVYKMHIQDIMQRTEMQLQSIPGLAVMFLDPKDDTTDSTVRNAYAEIYRDGDFISKYSHITDSLSFVLSNQSFGIHFADYTAGIFNNFMRGFQISTELFKKSVWSLVYKNPVGNPLGWGICEVPTDSSVRGKIREKLVNSGFLPSVGEEEAML